MTRFRSVSRPLAFVVALVMTLAGCRLEVGLDVSLQADGSGIVTVTATADAELVARAPSAFADLRLDDIRQAGWTVSGPTKAVDGALTVALAKPFATPAEVARVLAELNGPNGPLRGLALSFDRSFALVSTSFTGTAQLSGGLGAFSDAALVQALEGSTPLANLVAQPVDQVLGLTVTARLPGRVTSSNGEVAADRSSVAWRPSLTDGASTPLDARFALVDEGARSARRTSRLAWGALVVYAAALIVVGALVAVLLRRRRANRLG